MNILQSNLAAGLPYQIDSVRGAAILEQTLLTDGQRAELDPDDPRWVRFSEGTTHGIILDFGDEKSIERVAIRFLQYTDQKVFFPATVSVFASADGQGWELVTHIPTRKPMWHAGPPHDQLYVWDGKADGLRTGDKEAKSFAARYLKVTLTADLNLMADELEVWGTDAVTDETGRTDSYLPGYMAPGEHTAGIHDLVLLYNGHYSNGTGAWTKDNIIPYISYVDEQRRPIDWMFDGVLYLGLLSPFGHSFETGTAVIETEWKWYLDKTYGVDGDLDQMNDAVKEAAEQLGQSDKRMKVVLMLPNPGTLSSSFEIKEGQLAAYDGGVLSVAEELDMKKLLMRWYMDELMTRWSLKGYDHLELSGIYWLSEGVSVDIPQEDNLIRYMSEIVHEQGLHFFWIPFFYGGRSFDWRELGFDAVVLQPNHFFNGTKEERIEDTAYLAQLYGVGIEMECDERMNEDPAYRRRYIEYLNGGVKYGYMTNTLRGYYQGNTSLLDSARSTNPEHRELYDWTYQFIKGTYEIQELE